MQLFTLIFDKTSSSIWTGSTRAVRVISRTCALGFFSALLGATGVAAHDVAVRTGETDVATNSVTAVVTVTDSAKAETLFEQGKAYARGDGGEQDEVKALALYRQAAELGSAKAQHNIAAFYFEGRGGLNADAVEAAKWYRQAAGQGAALSQDTLGALLERGIGVTKNAAEASQWYRKAAEQGLASAQLHLGQLYYFGTADVKRDYAEATKWLALAAAQGDAPAQNNLGLIYRRGGRGVVKNYDQALSWFLKAAEQGNAKAQANLGELYVSNLIPRDPVKAYQWLSLSSDRGSVAGKKLLEERLRGFTPEQIAEGKRLAAEWTVAHRTKTESYTGKSEAPQSTSAPEKKLTQAASTEAGS